MSLKTWSMLSKFTLFLFSSFFLFLIPNNTLGQACGTMPKHMDDNRLVQNILDAKQIDFQLKNGIKYIPIQFFIVSDGNGNGGINEKNVLQALCLLNGYFAEVEMEFYLADAFEYLDNATIYNQATLGGTAVNLQYALHKKPGVVNVFVGGPLGTGNSGYYTGNQDVIYMVKGYLNGHDVILSHEMGHFFSLRHTFFGWEGISYDPNEPTPTEIVKNGYTYYVEYVDRDINCETSGDFLCGTPADYINNWNGGCDYTGGAVDPDSVLIDPDEANHMAYYSFAGCANYHFSDDQIAVIQMDYENRPALKNNPIPNLSEISDTALLVAPMADEIVAFYDDVEFKWNPVENADFYKLEITILPSFFATLYTYYTDQTSFTVTALNPDKDYYWRVTPFSKTDFCALEPGAPEHFNTSSVSLSKDLSNQENRISFYPNPVHGGEIFIDGLASDGLFSLKIFSTNGALMSSFKYMSSTLVDVSHLPSGLFLLELDLKGQKQYSIIYISNN